MKRGEELGVKVENFLDIIRFLTFVNIGVYGVAFPASQKLDVMSGDAVTICSDRRALS